MDDVLSDEALEGLERKRQAATPGPWEVDEPWRPGWIRSPDRTVANVPRIQEGRAGGARQDADCAYIAAANPEAVGRLIAEVRRMRDRPAVLHVKSSMPVEEWLALCESLRHVAHPHRLVLGPSMDGRAEALEKAAQFFERLVAEGDGEPLSLGAVARMLREQAKEKS